MKVNSFVVNVTSEQPDQLKKFYRETVALEPEPNIGDGAFRIGDAFFMIDGHSETAAGSETAVGSETAARTWRSPSSTTARS